MVITVVELEMSVPVFLGWVLISQKMFKTVITVFLFCMSSVISMFALLVLPLSLPGDQSCIEHQTFKLCNRWKHKFKLFMFRLVLMALTSSRSQENPQQKVFSHCECHSMSICLSFGQTTGSSILNQPEIEWNCQLLVKSMISPYLLPGSRYLPDAVICLKLRSGATRCSNLP